MGAGITLLQSSRACFQHVVHGPAAASLGRISVRLARPTEAESAFHRTLRSCLHFAVEKLSCNQRVSQVRVPQNHQGAVILVPRQLP